jgi:Na+/melibiose symporter-like transporter
MKKLTYITMNVYWFGLAFMWNGLHPIILPAVLLDFVPVTIKNTILGAITFVGLILAMVIQPLAGQLSDRTRSRWGRRRPWILVGASFTMLILAGMAFANSLFWLITAYLLLQVASNVAHGPAQGLIPDLVPEERRGLASGFKNLFDMAGLVVTSLFMGSLVEGGNASLTFFIMLAVLAVSLVITLVGTPEASAQGKPAQESQSWFSFLHLDVQHYPQYARLVLARLFILTGIYVVQSFAQYFIRDRLGMPNPAEVTGNLMATIGIAITALVFPAGWLSDRIGRKKLNVFAGGLAAVGIITLIFVKDITSLYAAGGTIGIATGIFVSVNWALATDLIPHEEAGKYMGLSNLATAGAAAISRLAGPLIDGVNALQPETFLGYPVAFGIAAAITLLGAVLMTRIKAR